MRPCGSGGRSAPAQGCSTVFDWTLRPKPVRSLAGERGRRRGKTMKIYLLMVLIGTLLTAIRFTSVRVQQQSKTLPNS